MHRNRPREDARATLYVGALAIGSIMVLSAALLEARPAAAEEPEPGFEEAGMQAGAPSAGLFTARLTALESAEGLSPEEKSKLAELLTQGLAAAEKAIALESDLERMAQQLRRAPTRQEEIGEALALPASSFDAEALTASTSPRDAEIELRESEAALANARQRVEKLTAALARQRQRPEAVQASLADAVERLETIERDLDTGAPPDASATLAETHMLVLGARQHMRQLEVAALERELGSHDLLLALARAELDLAEREVEDLERELGVWQAVVQRHREEEAAAKTQEAEAVEQALATMPEAVRAVAEHNTALSEELQDLATRESDAVARVTAADARIKEVGEDFAAFRERVELAGLNDTIALVLRKQRDSLPTMSDYRSLTRTIRAETSRASGRQLDHEARARELIDPRQAAESIVEALEPPVAEARKADLTGQVADLLGKQRELALGLRDGYGRYIKQLGRLENAERTLVARAEDFNRLIAEHLLWIRSAPPASPETLGGTASGLVWLIAPGRWWNVVRDLWRSVPDALFAWVVGILAASFLLASRARARTEISSAAASVGNVGTDSFLLTMRALLATVVAAAAWPMLAVAAGWPLLLSTASDPFSRAVGGGLLAVAFIGFGFALLHRLCGDGGVGDAHFAWPQSARRELRENLRWLAYVALPLGFVIWAIETYDDETIRASLGRAAFVLAMLALTVFIVRVLRPRAALMSAVAERHSNGFIARLRHLWAPLVAAAPFSLALLSLLGYHYSAVQLQNRLQATAWIVIVLVLVNESLMRWLVVTHRRLAHQRMLEEQEEARLAEGEVEARMGVAEDEFGEKFEEPEVDLDAIQNQTGSLIRTVIGIVAILGFWITWSAVLPALNILDEITVWQYAEMVEGVERQRPVTLIDLAVALLIAGLTYLGTKNLPGALELAVLNRTSLDAGAKYAFITLCRYVISGTGIILVFNYLGMEWSRLQWLLAALGVGLGFGLQEIVANFISGLILLFERPIRVGDIVTIDGSSGTVSRIRIRATTITDWDRKELIVPNKRFITGEVLNWTLSNELNRILVNVGVAYGADTERAREILLGVAERHPRILEEPAPVASFESFGDNTLNLVLRCYMPNLDGRIGVITDLHSAIDEAFKEAGIEIAFPQRDIHIDSAAPLEVRLLAERGGRPRRLSGG